MRTSPNLHHSVNPIYYVFFTTAVLCASFILFQGFNTTSTVNTVSLISGFIVIFLGTALLNQVDRRTDGHQPVPSRDEESAMPTDPISDVVSRYTMHSRRSSEHRRSMSGSIIFSPAGGVRNSFGDRERLMSGRRQGSISGVETNNAFGLHDLAEDEDELVNGNDHANGHMNGNGVHVKKSRSSRSPGQ